MDDQSPVATVFQVRNVPSTLQYFVAAAVVATRKDLILVVVVAAAAVVVVVAVAAREAAGQVDGGGVPAGVAVDPLSATRRRRGVACRG